MVPRKRFGQHSERNYVTRRQEVRDSGPDENNVSWLWGVPRLTKALEKDSVTSVVVRGGFGWIRRGRLTDGTSVAIKVLQPRDLRVHVQSVEESRRFRNEIVVWSRLQHRNVLRLLGLVELFVDGTKEMGLVSPWERNGNIADFCQKTPNLDRLPMIRGILNGLLYLHEEHVVHGDLRGANILISEHGNPMLCDFGLANIASEMTKLSVSSVLHGFGNCRWMAPELLIHDEDPSKASDVWAFGMVILELLTGKPPFFKSHDGKVVIALYNRERPEKPSLDAMEIGFSEGLWTVMQDCWDNDAERRPSVVELLPIFTPVPLDETHPSSSPSPPPSPLRKRRRLH